MAIIDTYTTLATAVADYLARSDLSGFINNFIQNWEERFFRNPRNWGPWMETAHSRTIASSVIAVPSDFLAWKVVQVAGSPGSRLEPCGLAELYMRFPRGTTSGYPVLIARNASNFEFGPPPDSTYIITGVYYAKPTLLRSDVDGANWLTANAPDLLLYGALLEAEPFLKNDGRIAIWQSFYQQALDDYRAGQKSQAISGGPMQIRVA